MISTIVNISGLILILIIIWWFLIAKPKTQLAIGNKIDILIQNGVYEPSIITAKQGQTLTVNFLRKDNSPCSEYVVFEKFNISAKLPYNKKHSIILQLNKAGTFDFTCQMGMYRGQLIVK